MQDHVMTPVALSPSLQLGSRAELLPLGAYPPFFDPMVALAIHRALGLCGHGRWLFHFSQKLTVKKKNYPIGE